MSTLYSGTSSTVNQTTFLLAVLLQTLGDRAGLLADPVIMGSFVGDLNGSAATQAAVPRSDLGTVVLASETEGTGVSVTDPTFARDSVTVAGRRLAHNFSDLFAALQAGRGAELSAFVAGLVQSTGLTVANVIAALSTGFSASEGTTGVALTVSEFIAGQIALAVADISGPTLGLLHSRQMGQLRNDALLTGGGQAAYSPNPDNRPGNTLKSGSYIADFFGSAVGISNQIPTSGGDKVGCLIGAQAIRHAFASPVVFDPTRQILLPAQMAPFMPPLLLSRDFDQLAGLNTVSGYTIFGAAEAQDLAGIRLISVNS